MLETMCRHKVLAAGHPRPVVAGVAVFAGGEVKALCWLQKVVGLKCLECLLFIVGLSHFTGYERSCFGDRCCSF